MATATTRTTWRRLKKNKGALIGIAIIALAILVAVFAYWLAPDGSPNANRMVVEIGGQRPGYSQQFLQLPRGRKIQSTSFFDRLFSGDEDKYQYIPITSYQQIGDSLIFQKYIDEGLTERMALPISQTRWQEGSTEGEFKVITKKFRLGTDKYGRDILSRLLVGVRVSLGVGLVTVLISLSIGVLLGAMAGYFRGRTDEIIMWFINVIWSIPTLLLVFAITLILGKGFWQVFIAIGLTMWVSVARIIRGQVLSVRELEYVEAAKALGYSHTRIVLRHVLPNVLGPVMVVAASNFASAIVIEAGLSFLGVGVQPPQPSWGLMIKENYNFIITHNPMLALAPGFAIMLLVLAFNMLGNGLRDALQVKE
ncbi:MULTISPECIES: ABC transporter permease [Niastella]|uniref:ABC transporter permease n=1 Tax=Niastella soli TaxID=2821487 RepID=A0ABS3YPS1_9BACT|nr:ABC transporter permease [Niastella soli]MBO9199881.1 ABC transporter permease [Niastella soli]